MRESSDDAYRSSFALGVSGDHHHAISKALAVLAGAAVFLPFAAEPALATGGADSLLSDTGFVQGFSLIFASEIGDKTFFIAALLAAKFSRVLSFIGATTSLSVVTLISVALGLFFQTVSTPVIQGVPLNDIIAITAFAYFGIVTLIDASQMEDDDEENEEKQEAEEAVEELTKADQRRDAFAAILSTFNLVFAAEIGDRSFFSTIALAAKYNPVAVSVGGILAHAFATLIAVLGGGLLSEYLSERAIGYIGGVLFLVFAAIGIYENLPSESANAVSQVLESFPGF